MRDLRVIPRITVAAFVILAAAACDSSSTDVDDLGVCHLTECVGLQGYWKLDTTPASHGTTLADVSGNSRTGTLVTDNGVTNKSITGQQQRAIGFDGTSDHVTVPDSPGLDLAGDFTLGAWINPALLGGGYQAVISKNIGSRPPSLWLLGNQVEVWFDPGGGQATSTGTVVASTWQHVVATFDDAANEIRIYINGTLDSVTSDVTRTPSVNDHPLVIGQRGDEAYFFNGGIDEVMVWSRALTAQEVQDIHEATD